MKKNLNNINIIGLSHKTANLEDRERVSIENNNTELLKSIINQTIEEAVVLSTCNRFEIYFVSSSNETAIFHVKKIIKDYFNVTEEKLSEIIYIKNGESAIFHLFSVSASLDSMVIGENEIINQVKEAYSFSVNNDYTGKLINKLFHDAFRVAKKVKTETGISSHPVSVSYIATILIKNIFKDLSTKNLLLIGAGQMAELLMKYLKEEEFNKLIIANRSYSNAKQLTNKYDLQADIIDFDSFNCVLEDIDLMISSVSCKDLLLDKQQLQTIMHKRNNKPLVIIDIGVPRNIDPECKVLTGVFLHNIDDLQTIAYQNQVNRIQEIGQAEKIIEKAVKSFKNWHNECEAIPVISRMQNKFDNIRKSELDKYRRRYLNHLTDEDHLFIEELTKSIMNKTLHNPISYIKKMHSGKKEKSLLLDSKQIIEDMLVDEK